MKILTLPAGQLLANTYLVIKNKDAILIDPTGEENDFHKIDLLIKKENITLKAILFTHGHFDHIMLGHKYQGIVPIYIHKGDKEFIEDRKHALVFGFDFTPFKADKYLNGGEILTFGDITVNVIHTPGHSKGSVCYLIGDCIFSGDTLFYESVGRTDLEGGSWMELKASIEKIFALEGQYTVYPGHDQKTDLEHERRYNPYV